MRTDVIRSLDSEISGAMRAATERFEEELDDVSRDLAEHVLGEIRDEPELTAELEAAAQGSLRAWVGIVRRGALPTGIALPEEAARFARTYALRGEPLLELLRVYRLGHSFFFRRWLGALLAGEPSPDILGGLVGRSVDLSFAYVDAMSAQIADFYASERARLVRSTDAARTEIARAIVAAQPVDIDAASRTLSYELRRWHVGMTLWATAADEADAPLGRLESAAGEIANELGCARPLLVPAGRRLLWAWSGTQDAVSGDVLRALAHGRRRQDGVSAALGAAGEGIQGFARSHTEAQEARRIALLDPREHGKLTWYADVSLVSLLTGDVERARQFMHAELGALALDDDATARLRATLKVYLEEGRSVVAAARRLSVHQSTVKYRIRKCHELLGRSPGERAQKLEAAILLADSLKRSS